MSHMNDSGLHDGISFLEDVGKNLLPVDLAEGGGQGLQEGDESYGMVVEVFDLLSQDRGRNVAGVGLP